MLRRTPRSLPFAALLSSGLALTAPPASAQYAPIEEPPPETYRSPQHFAMEIKFGLYSPHLDSSPGVSGHPFSDLFVAQDDLSNVGRPPPGRLLTTLEFDWQFWQGFGSLGLAASVGIQRRYTHAFQYTVTMDSAGNATNEPCQIVPGVINCTRSSDTTTLSVMPFALEVVYRFDVLARKWHVPLVPYLKGGVAYYLWWVENGSGAISRMVDASTGKVNTTKTCGFGGDCGIGGTFGLVAHPGLAFLLDVLDPSAARTIDAELGINHTYLFAELHYAWITGFGSSTKLNLSDTTWNAGLAFEF